MIFRDIANVMNNDVLKIAMNKYEQNICYVNTNTPIVFRILVVQTNNQNSSVKPKVYLKKKK